MSKIMNFRIRCTCYKFFCIIKDRTDLDLMDFKLFFDNLFFSILFCYILNYVLKFVERNNFILPVTREV